MDKKSIIYNRVYAITKKIPKGKIATYGIVAKKARTSARAAGQILKRNPYQDVPCHRVVMCDGKVGGYRGNHSNEKIRKLKKEGIVIKNKKIQNFKKYLI